MPLPQGVLHTISVLAFGFVFTVPSVLSGGQGTPLPASRVKAWGWSKQRSGRRLGSPQGRLMAAGASKTQGNLRCTRRFHSGWEQTQRLDLVGLNDEAQLS